MSGETNRPPRTKAGASVPPHWRLALTALTPLTEDENPGLGGSFSLDGRAEPLELVVHTLNMTGASGVGSVVIDEPQEPPWG